MACHNFDVNDPDLLDMDPLHPRVQYLQERDRQKRCLIMRRRRLRDTSNPFDVTYEAFVKSYRLSQDLFFSLVDLIRPFMDDKRSPLAVPLQLRVLACLSFYASGSYQTPTGRQFDFPMAQSTLSDIISEVTRAVNADEVLARFIRFPSTVEEVEYCIRRNRMLGGKINNVVGYTDGTLIKIRKPCVADNIQAFYGRKNYPCINAQITCDRRLYIMNVVPNFPGRTHDSQIFAASALRERMVELFGQRRCHLFGDSGYALEPWMMVPFNRQDRPEEDTPEDRYNKDHCSDRNCVERCIGKLKAQFRCINDERILHYHHVKAGYFTNAVCVISNLAVLENVPDFMDDDDFSNDNCDDDEPEEFEDDGGEDGRQVAELLARGRAIRQQIVQELERNRH